MNKLLSLLRKQNVLVLIGVLMCACVLLCGCFGKSGKKDESSNVPETEKVATAETTEAESKEQDTEEATEALETEAETEEEETEVKEEKEKKPTSKKPSGDKKEDKKPEDSNSNVAGGNAGGLGNNQGGNQGNTPVVSDYKLVWEDNFDGDALSLEDWNYEYHEPGWVNAEWQEYVDAEENIYVEDGNLIIQAIKSELPDGSAYYTSGRVNTQNKHDFKYGKFEARLKVPSGKGFLPAFWMMPTDESFYGQWPKCGEIDIMEVLGDNTKVAHGTLHFGEPHAQKQGTYELASGDFSSEYHVFACEWEPGEIRFYIDGKLYYTENDWFTKRPGFGEVAYPAPFDQPFYMILNVAVGGSWVGYPDETTEFGENARMVVDYVRVYQKDAYNEDVEKPIKDVTLRDPDASGNYVINGDFAVTEDLNDAIDWQFLLAGGGEGAASISGNELHIATTNHGTLDYSVQMVQPKIPLEQGYQYRLSFDAYADEERTIITDITAPDLNYIRYLADQKITVTTEKENYAFIFDMTSENDPNGRVEFNLGNQGSTATVHITNVRVEKVGTVEIEEADKSVLPDGNYVYNGSFQEGVDRMDYWTVANQCSGAKVSVTNADGVRELKAEVPETVSGLDALVLKQDIALTGGKTYSFAFDAYAAEVKTIQAKVAGQTFDVELTTARREYTFEIVTPAGLNGAEVEFLLGVAGTTYLDDVRIQEAGMIVNGDFVNGFVGYEVYLHEESDVTYGVDELTENQAAGFTIKDTGSQDWQIQLKQNNIKLEEGKWYKIQFEAKSSLDRKIMYALQRDGSSDDNWIPYSGTQVIDLTAGYNTYSHTFQMKNTTDEKTILSISMGAVGGTRIRDMHTVYIDNITLEEVEAPAPSDEPEVEAGTELIKNGDFANGSTNWEPYKLTEEHAVITFEDGKAIFDIRNVGDEDWNVQLKQSGILLKQGSTYTVSFKMKSSEARTVKAALLNASYAWYGGADIVLEKDVLKEVSFEVPVSEVTESNITFVLSMGKIAGTDTPLSVIEVDDISIKENGGAGSGSETPSIAAGTELIVNGDFANGNANWEPVKAAADYADITFEDGKATFDIHNVGDADWNVQIKQHGICLEQGSAYTVSFKIKSSEARTVRFAFLNAGYDWYGGTDIELEKDVEKVVNLEIAVTKATDSNISFVLSLGLIGDSTPLSIIELDDVSVKKL